MKSRRRKLSIVSLLLALLAGLIWQGTPIPAVLAVAHLSDPAKLARLGERGANARLNKIVYWLADGQSHGSEPETTLRWAQRLQGANRPGAALVRESLSRNLRIAGQLGLLSAENQARLRRGQAGVISLGPYAGETAEVDHIVPVSLAPELGNELANLEMLPRTLNRAKSNRIGSRQLDLAEDFLNAGLMSKESFARVRAAAPR